MASTVLKRSIVIDRHKTSISIEDAFWISLKDIARQRGSTLSELVASIDAARGSGTNLSSAIRVFILDYFRAQLVPRAEGPAERSATRQPANVRR